MRRVFLIISFLCLLPFTTMAQTRSSSYDEKLEQLYGQSPLAKDGPKEMLNLGMKGQLDENYAYAFLIPEGNDGTMYQFDVTEPQTLTGLATFEGFHITAAEVVAYNSTTDIIYAYTSDGRFCTIDPETMEVTTIASGISTLTEMTYDPVRKVMYGLRYGVIYYVDLETGAITPVNDQLVGADNWVALAVNMDGVMYGITNTYSHANAKLYTINTNDWNCRFIANLPYMTQYTQTMSFNRDSNELYWWQASSIGFNFIKVDPETGSCINLYSNNQRQMAGLLFKYTPIHYNITYETVENGSFSGVTLAAENDEITVNVTPAYGYRLGSLTWNGNPIDIEAGEPYVFTMPGEDVVVSGEFLLNLHNIIVLDPKDGTLATDPANEGFYSNTITVIPTPDPGFEVQSITYAFNGEEYTLTEAPYEFIMPDYDVTVSAQYVQVGVNGLTMATDLYGYFDDIVTVEVFLNNECLVSAAQMDITLGENLTYVANSIALTDRAEGEGWNVGANVIGNNILRITAFNALAPVLSHFTGNEGAILTFQVACARVPGMNDLLFSGVYAGTPDATNLTIGNVAGALEIKDVVMNLPTKWFATTR